MRYDLIVIGNEPSGLLGALTAAKLNKKVALIEQRSMMSAKVSAPPCPVPTHSLREAVLTLTGFKNRAMPPHIAEQRREVTMPQLLQLANQIARQESDALSQQLERLGVERLNGFARFVAPNEVELDDRDSNQRLTSDRFLLAVGSTPNRPTWVPFDGQTVLDPSEFLQLNSIPATVIVVGAEIVGIECALMLAVLGSEVVVTDSRSTLLEFCDRELVDWLQQRAISLGVRFRLGMSVTDIERLGSSRVAVNFADGAPLMADAVVYASGRMGNTDQLGVSAAGLTTDEHGRLWCNEHHQTWVKHIYGVGDVVGFPAYASVSKESGRQAVQHAFGVCTNYRPIPFSLATIPEMAMIGTTEERLREQRIPYEIGIAPFHEVPFGLERSAAQGRLKLLFHRDSKQLLGVHCLGDFASELIGIGNAVMSFGGGIEAFQDAVLNEPTLANCYHIAANNSLQTRMPSRDTSPTVLADTIATKL